MLMESDKTPRFRGGLLIVFILMSCLFLPASGFMEIAYAQSNRAASPQPGNQKITIKGTITDESGEPLPGANVLVKGTSIGASADADGNYSLSFVRSSSKSDVLIFSFIGSFIRLKMPGIIFLPTKLWL